MDVFIDGKKFRVSPKQAIGKGGEADVYNLGDGRALKIFKPPTHPDYADIPDRGEREREMCGARDRIALHQEKLPAFPRDLPDHVVVPADLAMDAGGSSIVGYAMPLLTGAETFWKYGHRGERPAGITNEHVQSILRNLHRTVQGCHAKQVVIGDFNDLNVLVVGEEPYLIDVDSFQFGKYLCRAFTVRFVDPLRCDPHASSLLLAQPHTPDSDWYAFTVMLMRSLLFVEPYGGVFKPKDRTKLVPHDARPQHRITIFHPEVICPKVAIPYGRLPDDLLHHLQQVFEKDLRGVFPMQLLESMRWTTCAQCQTEHARALCPNCQHAAPAAIREVTVIRGQVTATRIFRTHGRICQAAMQDGALCWLYHEDHAFRREDGALVISGGMDPKFRYRLQGRATLIARDDQLATISPHAGTQRRTVEQFQGRLPVYDTNARHAYWLEGGTIYRDGDLAQERIGDVLAGQTLFWVGPAFGFGFYRAGELNVAFVFDAERRGINDAVSLPRFHGQILDVATTFSNERCWFFVAYEHGGKTVHRCTVIRPDGGIEATMEATAGEPAWSWLGTIRGHAATGKFLLAATDDGIVRVEVHQGQLAATKSFPDTEPFVGAGDLLFAGKDGLYVVSRSEITRLQIR
ncbi:hypothetical protein HYV74_04375 [Candidatus Uhrbacteria bacterium]|nr:hypothetical protein [Candidatus Uhrbacteria bacterium]